MRKPVSSAVLVSLTQQVLVEGKSVPFQSWLAVKVGTVPPVLAARSSMHGSSPQLGRVAAFFLLVLTMNISLVSEAKSFWA